MEREKTGFEKFIEALPHHDTVVCKLTGLGETEFSTREIYEGLERLIIIANSEKVRNISKNNSVIWMGKCPKCGTIVLKHDEYERCSNMNCKSPIRWE